MAGELIEHGFDCPYCGAPITMLLDPVEGSQRYVEDCEVCCNPIVLLVEFEEDELVRFEASASG